jgi:hypothetical protein
MWLKKAKVNSKTIIGIPMLRKMGTEEKEDKKTF